jgi:Protein of unknown function (DUF3089)
MGRLRAGLAAASQGLRLWSAIRPRHAFGSRQPPPAPDYSLSASWAARPDRRSHAMLAPPGVEPGDRQAEAAADVFFIHPTMYFGRENWNARVDDPRVNELVDEMVIPLEASIFNASCRVWAPRYRQATLYAFLGARKSARKALELAFGDVRRAFEHWVEHLSGGRPFFIAGHSQGCLHAIRLLEEVIDRDPALVERLVAAYPIGFTFPMDKFERGLRRLRPADEARDHGGVVVAWDTWLEGGGPSRALDRGEHWYPKAGSADRRAGDDAEPRGSWERRAWKTPLCVNPLTWRRDGATAPRELHRGAVAVELAGRPATFSLTGDDPLGFRLAGLSAPKPHLVSARCDKDGYLYISEPPDPELRTMVMPGGNYHNYDLAMFYMDVRHNVAERLAAYLAAGRGAAASQS